MVCAVCFPTPGVFSSWSGVASFTAPPDADFKLVAQTEDASHVAIPLRKGDASATLLDAINTAIDELRADGTLKELSEKYFGQDISAEN